MTLRSELWNQVGPEMLNARQQLEFFRLPGQANSRLAHWEPAEASLRWFKSYLQMAANGCSAEEISYLSSGMSMSLGNPVEVCVRWSNGVIQSVNLDYLYAAEEAACLATALDFNEIRTVCELGAGFGRTAHVLLNNFSSIDSYCIVDLPETLGLSQDYLAQVLDAEAYSRIKFIDATADFDFDLEVDLVIQIDGFQEMTLETIDYYFDQLISNSKYFYSCNPVGKYDPKTAGVHGSNPEGLAAALGLGRSRLVVDPWNEVSLSEVRDTHVSNYLPHGFETAQVTASRLRPYYLHSIYKRTEQRST